MRPQLFIRSLHKWMGLVLGLQILLWFLSGFLMSWMPIEEIHGDHLLQPAPNSTLAPVAINLSELSTNLNEPINSVHIKSWLGKTVIEVDTGKQIHLFDGTTMQKLSPLNEQQIREVLQAHISPEFELNTINLLSAVPAEARGRQAPLWMAQYAGAENPRIYISAQTGEIVAKRTDRWRLFDFLWMLHIMDYDEREDFNHPLLYLTALSAFLFTLTGFVLIYYKFRKKPKQ